MNRHCHSSNEVSSSHPQFLDLVGGRDLDQTLHGFSRTAALILDVPTTQICISDRECVSASFCREQDTVGEDLLSAATDKAIESCEPTFLSAAKSGAILPSLGDTEARSVGDGTDSQLAFVAAIPLIQNGVAIGTISAIDHGPRKVDSKQVALLESLAKNVVQVFDLRTGIIRENRDRQHISAENVRNRLSNIHGAEIEVSEADLICTIDNNGFFTYINPGWSQSLGYTEEEFMSRGYREYIHPEDLERTDSATTGLSTRSGVIGFVNRYRTKNGSYRWLRWVADVDARTETVYAMARDITDEVEIDRLKGEIISTVSHELRTSLTSIRASLRLVMAGAAGTIDSKARSCLSIADRNANRVIQMVSDMLDLERIESQDFTLKLLESDLGALIDAAIEQNQEYSEGNGVELKFDERPESVALAYIDPDRVHQVLDNLISNASKYAAGTGVVRISLHDLGEIWEVSVADKGPGIPKEFQDRVFERFSQADARTNREVMFGSGLGLAIVRGIVDAHNGSIDFETSDAGTTFSFRLPKLTSENSVNPTRQESSKQYNGTRA